MSERGPASNEERNAIWWREKAARNERLLAEIADIVRAPRASDYGDLPAFVAAWRDRQVNNG